MNSSPPDPVSTGRRVLVAGGTGAIGRQLAPLLVAQGHNVTVLSRRASAAPILGAHAVQADVLDAGAVLAAVEAAAPDAVVGLTTAIPQQLDPRRMDQVMAATNALRTTGTLNLIRAAEAVGARQLVGESLAYAYDPDGPVACDEDDPLWRRPPPRYRSTVTALIDHEAALRAAGGAVLRFGHLYGPGTAYAAGGSAAQQVRTRRFPVVGRGSGIFSFVHVRDAARAVAAHLQTGGPSVLNVVDDKPWRNGSPCTRAC